MVQDTNADNHADNRLPELYSSVSPATSSIPLQAGSGAYAGRWASTGVPDSEPTHGDSLLGLASIQALQGLGPAAEVLYNSSGGRWKTPLCRPAGGPATGGGHARAAGGGGGDADIFDQSSTFALGSSQTLQFLPTFHAAQTALAGVCSASFRLVSLAGLAWRQRRCNGLASGG